MPSAASTLFAACHCAVQAPGPWHRGTYQRRGLAIACICCRPLHILLEKPWRLSEVRHVVQRQHSAQQSILPVFDEVSVGDCCDTTKFLKEYVEDMQHFCGTTGVRLEQVSLRALAYTK